MVQRFAKLASVSFSASSSRRTRTDIPMTRGVWAELVLTSLGAVAIAFFITIAIGAASAQEHRHPLPDEQLHYKFYSNWMMPNRDSPDGRNHLCAPSPRAYQPPDTVFCFKPGAGI